MTPVEDYKMRAEQARQATEKARWSLLRALLSLRRAGVTQAEMARTLGVSQGHVSRILSHFDEEQEPEGPTPNPLVVLGKVMGQLRDGAQ